MGSSDSSINLATSFTQRTEHLPFFPTLPKMLQKASNEGTYIIFSSVYSLKQMDLQR